MMVLIIKSMMCYFQIQGMRCIFEERTFTGSPDVFSHCPKYVPEGESLVCNCQFSMNQRWPTIEGSVTWPKHSSNSTLVVMNVTRADNGTVFTCAMTKDGIKETSNYTLHVAYGPLNVSIHADSPLISDGTNNLHLTCVAAEVYPLPRYAWNIFTCLNNDTDKGSCVLKPQPPWDDGKEVRCTATNTVGQAKVTGSYKLSLNYPPPKPPEILGYKPILVNGDHLQCRVSGGKPLVKTVNFSCSSDPPLEDQQDTIEGSSMLSNVTISTKDTEDYSMVCVCSAIWEPRENLYTKTSNVTVFVSNDNQERETDLTKIKIGTAVAFSVVIIVIVITVVIHAKNKGRRRGVEKEILESCHQSGNLSQESHITCSDYEDVETPRNQPASNIHNNIHRSRRRRLNDVTEIGPSSQEIALPKEDETFSSREHLCEFSSQLGAQSPMEEILNQSLHIIPSCTPQMKTAADESVYSEIDLPAQEGLDASTATTELQTTSSRSATHERPAVYDKCVCPHASISSSKKNKSQKEEWELYNTIQRC